MNFKEIMRRFESHKTALKVISVASCGIDGKPNNAPKMLIDVILPDSVFFIDYHYSYWFGF